LRLGIGLSLCRSYIERSHSTWMTSADREHAAALLVLFLEAVGPREAVWAMTTALEALQDLPADADHVAAAIRSLAESHDEFIELKKLPGEPETWADGEPETSADGEAEARPPTTKKAAAAAKGEQP
jgi:hypothetical protein